MCGSIRQHITNPLCRSEQHSKPILDVDISKLGSPTEPPEEENKDGYRQVNREKEISRLMKLRQTHASAWLEQMSTSTISIHNCPYGIWTIDTHNMTILATVHVPFYWSERKDLLIGKI